MSDFNVPDDEKTEAKEAEHGESQDEHTKLERSIKILEACGELCSFYTYQKPSDSLYV